MNTTTYLNRVKAHPQLKPRFAITRESPNGGIMDLLQSKSARIDFRNPHVPAISRKRGYHFDLQSVVLNANTLADYGRAVLATDHHAFNYPLPRHGLRACLSGWARNREK